MQPYEKVVYIYRGAPGNSYVLTLLLDPVNCELKVKDYHTRYKGTRRSTMMWSVPDFLNLKLSTWPYLYKLSLPKVRQAVLDLMIKAGAEQVDDVNAYRT